MYRVQDSNLFNQTQLLVAPDRDFDNIRFASSVAISNDERWMYVGTPGNNSVYAYGRVDIENQYVTHTTDGVNFAYEYSNEIQIDQDELSLYL